MRKLDFNEYKLCQLQAKLFEASIEHAHFSSPMFIRRFMMSDLVPVWDSKQYLVLSTNTEDTFDMLHEQYKESTRNPLYTRNEMYWIGYIYRAIVCLYGLSSKYVYKLFPAKKIREYYATYHTFDIEEAAERMMDASNHNAANLTEKGVEILRRLYHQLPSQ